jgi:GT2 family glycosyltransferase
MLSTSGPRDSKRIPQKTSLRVIRRMPSRTDVDAPIGPSVGTERADDAASTMEKPLPSVAVVVVTYNRKRLLEQTLQRIRAQTYPIARVFVIDNLSTDGTRDFLAQLDDRMIEPVLMASNRGGAGGFSAGIERAYRLGTDLIWVMDDDVLPDADALKQLVKMLVRLRKIGAKPNFLISNVSNSSGEPVNTPIIDLRLQPNGNLRWPLFLQEGVLPIFAASFVGTLITRDAVESYGLPIAEMFIWGDDIEFTSRLTKDHEAGYVVGNSHITHLGRGAEVSIFLETEPARARNFFYFYRNNVYILRKYGTKQRIAAFLLKLGRDGFRLFVHLQMRKLFIVLRGVAHGLVFSPPIRHVEGGACAKRRQNQS